jgi:class 3 adenylate cyclase
VTTSSAPGSRRQGALLLADISGYTAFLQGVADAHRDLIVEADEPPPAYSVLSQLLDTMVGAVGPTFRLAKFEGDAIFAVSADGRPEGPIVLACLRHCYAAFRDRLAAAGSEWTCSCTACARIGELDLKFVLHHGGYVAQVIAGREELLGPEVNVAHRLLKNRARDLVGGAPYALLTRAAVEELGIPTDGMVAAEETHDGGQPIAAHVLALA